MTTAFEVASSTDFETARSALPNRAFPITQARAWLLPEECALYDAASCPDFAVRIDTSVRLKEHKQLEGRARRKAEDNMTPEQEARATAASQMMDLRQEVHYSTTLLTTFRRLARERWERAGSPAEHAEAVPA